jgi:hypothetical protein
MAPLSMSETEFKELDITGHSMHGSPTDWAAVIGPSAPAGLAFGPEDESELGHWRRRARQGSQLVRVASDSIDSAFAHSARAENGSMRVRYLSGEGREGRRRAQIRVRSRLMHGVQHAFSSFGEHWTELPLGRGDIAILEDMPDLPPVGGQSAE